ncbi:MAG: hypothetical protein KAQ67_05875 [Gammaproteobacteria bacterium]|nr:hypothetical protein [Gammaproteobacteria bacterium]
MQVTIGWVLLIFGGALYVAQIISSFNFSLAQRLGIQEKAEDSDTLLQRSERYTAYWDLVTLLWLPIAGILMIINHAWWPILSLMAGAIYLDTSGREAAKTLSFRHEGIRVGTDKEQQVFFVSYIVMAVIAVIVIAYSILKLSSQL